MNYWFYWNRFTCYFIKDDPNEETNLADDSNYASILTDLEDKVDAMVSEVYEYETSGNCDESEVLDSDGNWITGCCNI